MRCNSDIHVIESPYVVTSLGIFSLLKQNGKTFAILQTFNEFVYTENGYGVEIGNDVWICENVFINGG